METKSINGVEIFSVGNWNGDPYTIEDLQEMVKAFEENKVGSRPFLKLGHDKKQKLLQSDGLPAAGWVSRLYIKGDKLVADFIDIPSKIYALIKSKAYRKVSSEIFWNIKIGEKTYKRMVAAVALLGSDTPGVSNLDDILALYNQSENFEKIGLGNDLELFALDLEEQTKKEFSVAKTELELKLEQELAEQKKASEAKEAELKEFKLAQEKKEADLAKENAELKEFKLKSEAEKAELAAKAEQAENEKFVGELVNEKLATPAMKEFVIELIGPDKKEYTAKKLNKKDAVKEMLKLFKAGKDVNFEDNSSEGDKEKKNFTDEMDKKAKEYAKEKNCSYGQAMKAVMKDSKK